MIEIDTEETKTCEECPTILDIDDFFLCQDCEEEQEKAWQVANILAKLTKS